MTHVFMSYSRHNLEFVLKLADSLKDHAREVWFDQIKEPLEDIPPGSKWWDEIKYGIETADNFLFIISPTSIVSPYCNAEVAYALQQERRLVTALYCGQAGASEAMREIDAAIDAIPGDSELPKTVSATITNLRSLTRRNWLEVSRVQYVTFSDSEGFDQSIDRLIQGLDLDLAWIKMWSEFRQAAQIWDETGRDDLDRWSERRLAPIRKMVEKRNQELTDLERDFLRTEYDRLWDELIGPSPVFNTREDVQHYHRRRGAIGDRLDELGDCEHRPGVGLVTEDLPPLPVEGDAPILAGTPAPVDASTVSLEVRLWGDKPEHLGLPDILWLPVEGGRVQLKQLEEHSPEEGVRVQPISALFAPPEHGNPIEPLFKVQPFYIAKHPITYVQFQAFLDAEDGFRNPTWWVGLAADVEHRSEPGRQDRPSGNHPRENVSWYDAIAFCRWLSARLGLPQLPGRLTVERLATYEGIRLPTEWEWQWAAQGGDGRGYPWGDEWNDARANTSESGLSRTTAVGMYPAGASPFGALDMSGNVWEWCMNEVNTLKNVRLAGDENRSQRGGAWLENADVARVDARNKFISAFNKRVLSGFFPTTPRRRRAGCGFRVVAARPPVERWI